MELHLHLGAHRTGTTAFQQMCRRHSAELATAGVAVWGPDVMRRPERGGFGELSKRAAAGEPSAQQDRDAAIAVFRHEFEAQAARGTERLVVSEENLIGVMDLNFRQLSLYPRAGQRLAAYSKLWPKPPRRVFLAIRPYVEYWSSCFAFVAIRKALKDIEIIREGVLTSARGWPDLINEISAAWPQAEIVVWPYERDPLAHRGWGQRMLGLTDTDLSETPVKPVNAGFSKAALERAMVLREANLDIAMPDLRKAVEPLNGPDAPKFQMFEEKDTGTLTNRYERDLALLRGHPNKNIRVFDPALDQEPAR